MKKITLILLIFNIAFGKIDYTRYEKYVDDISNYTLELVKPTYNPFYIPHLEKKEKVVKIKKPETKLKILAIVNNNNKVLLNFKNGKESKNIWLAIGQTIGDYKLIKITKEAVLLKYKNKIKVLKINKNRFKVRVSK